MVLSDDPAMKKRFESVTARVQFVAKNGSENLGAALVFNNILPGRHYPTAFAPRPVAPVQPIFREEDLLAALRSMEGFIDVSPDDLELIYERARDHLRQHWDGVRAMRK